jgi:hypothetical protein
MSGTLLLPDGRRIPIKGGLVIGRAAGCDVTLTDHKASRRHAALRVEGSIVEIEDLGSSNGTLLNAHPVTRRILRHGDRIRIGQSELVFEEAQPPDVAPPPPAPDPPAPAPPPLARVPLPPPAPPAAPREPAATLEFFDEVVELRAPPPSSAPSSLPAAGVEVTAGQRLLRFDRHGKRQAPGLLGDDLAQMSFLQRWGLVLLVLLFAVAVGYGVLVLVA